MTQQAQVEVRSLDSQERNEMNARLTKLKTAFANAKAEYGAIKNETAKSSLVGERSGKQRQRLVDTNQKIQKQNETILNATRAVQETEEVGVDITTELQLNREKITGAHEKLREATGEIDAGQRITTSMIKREKAICLLM